MEINNKLYSEIENYCKINEIDDIEKYINNLLRQAFTKDKYSTIAKVEKVDRIISEEIIEPIIVAEPTIIIEKEVIKPIARKKKEVVINKPSNNSSDDDFFMFRERNEDE